MHHSAYVNAEKFAIKYIPNLEGKKILDVGSYDVNGTLKPIFEKGIYTGLDMEAGPNVDVVSDAHNIPFDNEHFDIVTSSSCFEHDDMFWVTFLEMCRVVKPGGYLYVQAPSNGPYHGWPGDNWRFYIDSWKALEKWGKREGYDIELVEHYIDETTPAAPHEGNRIWNDSVAIYKKKPLQKLKNKVALISTYCDNQEKLDVLEKNIGIVKSYGLDVIVVSPIVLPESIQKQCDYYFLTKDNPVLDWPKRAMYIWRQLPLDDEKITITTTYPDYGWAGLLQVRQLSDIALMLNYDCFYHMIYDLKIDDNVKHYFDNPHQNLIFPSKRGNEIWKVGLHLMIFDRNNLTQFKSLISEESYFAVKGDHAFKWLERTIGSTKSEIAQTPVEDEIYYYEGHDFFNSSPAEGVKFFINKNDEVDETIKLLFYYVSEPKRVRITINDNFYDYVINKDSLIDLGFDKFNIPKVLFKYMGVQYDITDTIKKIKHSTLNVIK